MRATIFHSTKQYLSNKFNTRRVLFVGTLLALLIVTQSILAQEVPIPVPPSPETSLNGNQQPATSGLTTNSPTLNATGNGSTSGLVPLTTTSGACNGQHQDPVQLMWFYKPPTNSTTEGIVPHFDSYVLTKNDESTVSKINNLGENPVLQYIKFDNIDDPCKQALKPQGTACNCSKKPLNNQVAWNAVDVCWIRDNHPDWFLRDTNNNLLYFENQLMMDPGNRGWQDFWIDRIKTSQPQGWDGVFFDNLATEFGMHHADFSKKLKQYPTVESYRNAVVGFLSYVRSNYFAPNNRLMYANTSTYWNQDSTYFRYLEHLDGTQDEFWAYPRTGWYRIKSFQRRLDRLGGTLDRNKAVYLVSQGSRQDTQRQQFGVATYLLIAAPK
ncbi:MAG: hypothetical protein H7X77_00980, partial [Anaerolineae bacterium]|nr:hypothetical protein [Anaerolineae bacterium]